ncbi:hypothetical protein PR048_017885 [Dryococelus australis]|uniref:Uncharacterized protein n=1 Tax=Dryococelus australis TaxID=614101 RepID=A0ABQ9HAW4_9NEOP|nr:hypothetical protein PR048_017885 [Dryococelus australis]
MLRLPDFRMWRSCRTMLLVGGVFSGTSRFPRPCIPAPLPQPRAANHENGYAHIIETAPLKMYASDTYKTTQGPCIEPSYRLSNNEILGSPLRAHRYTQCDQNTARHLRTLRLEALAHLRVAVSPLSFPRCAASNAGKRSRARPRDTYSRATLAKRHANLPRAWSEYRGESDTSLFAPHSQSPSAKLPASVHSSCPPRRGTNVTQSQREKFTSRVTFWNAAQSSFLVGKGGKKYKVAGGRGGVVARLLASHLGEPGSIPGRVTPGPSHVGIVLDDSSGRQILSRISRFPRHCISALLHTHLTSPSSALKTSINSATRECTLQAALGGSVAILTTRLDNEASKKFYKGFFLKSDKHMEHQDGNRVTLPCYERFLFLQADTRPGAQFVVITKQILKAHFGQRICGPYSDCINVALIEAERRNTFSFPRLHGGYWLLLRAPRMYSSEQAPAYLATVHHTPLHMDLRPDGLKDAARWGSASLPAADRTRKESSPRAPHLDPQGHVRPMTSLPAVCTFRNMRPFSTIQIEKPETDKGYTTTRVKCAIAATRKALHWRAVFSSCCVYLAFYWREDCSKKEDEGRGEGRRPELSMMQADAGESHAKVTAVLMTVMKAVRRRFGRAEVLDTDVTENIAVAVSEVQEQSSHQPQVAYPLLEIVTCNIRRDVGIHGDFCAAEAGIAIARREEDDRLDTKGPMSNCADWGNYARFSKLEQVTAGRGIRARNFSFARTSGKAYLARYMTKRGGVMGKRDKCELSARKTPLLEITGCLLLNETLTDLKVQDPGMLGLRWTSNHYEREVAFVVYKLLRVLAERRKGDQTLNALTKVALIALPRFQASGHAKYAQSDGVLINKVFNFQEVDWSWSRSGMQSSNKVYPRETQLDVDGAAVAQRVEHSPPTKANGVLFPMEWEGAGSLLDFRMWELCRTMPLVGGFSRGSPVSPDLAFRRRSNTHLASPSSALKTLMLSFKRKNSRHVPGRGKLSPLGRRRSQGVIAADRSGAIAHMSHA